MREITNAEFNKARNQHIVLMHNLARRYAGLLSDEVREAACDIALWRCLRSYDPKFGQKVASSLYRFVQWECLRAIQEEQATCPDSPITSEVEDEPESVAIGMILNDYLSLLNTKARRIVEARFLENRTLDEIAQVEGYSKQGIKDIVDRSIGVMSEAAQTH